MVGFRLLTITAPLSAKEHKRVLENCQGSIMKCWRVTVQLVRIPTILPVFHTMETGVSSGWLAGWLGGLLCSSTKFCSPYFNFSHCYLTRTMNLQRDLCKIVWTYSIIRTFFNLLSGSPSTDT